jgi:transposase
MDKSYADLLKKNDLLKKENSRKDGVIEKLQKTVEELVSEVNRLSNELRKYRNENTPPSANKHMKPNTQGQQSKNGKRGAPEGHVGVTREQAPEGFSDVDADECPKCHSGNLKDVDTLKRVTEEIPVPVKPKVIETKIHRKKCKNCGNVFIPPQNTVPLEGKFGINLMILILMMKFLLRGVLRKAASFLEYGFAFTITPASVNSVVKRAANAATNEYAELKNRIKNSSKVHADETSFSVLGINWWLWIFRTEKDILFVIRRSRGQDVLREVLGEDYSGILICDCWRVYDFLAKASIQRCWAHLLRKLKALETVPGRHFCEKLQMMFRDVNRFNESKPTEAQRIEKYKEMTEELGETIRYYERYGEVRPVAKYVDNHFGQWFTCVRFPDVEPTNNLAEQGIRESVMVRKIIGAFRSVEGAAYYERLASLFATWQLRKLDVQAELRRVLVANLCLS